MAPRASSKANKNFFNTYSEDFTKVVRSEVKAWNFSTATISCPPHFGITVEFLNYRQTFRFRFQNLDDAQKSLKSTFEQLLHQQLLQ